MRGAGAPAISGRAVSARSPWTRDHLAAALSLGNAGDVKAVGSRVSELRVDYGPGYRVYFARRGKALVLLLCGGDKRSQARDIKTAKAMTADLG